ncbi:hypothetical protein [Pseudoxanthomonas sp. SE1]|uniref:hypothetical protein n=1 Tax=Pseudoxanthomonas sp. SE1 TaxID=1664560 RepID=UPI00240D0F16|nr:hypothetical protein [Pseudoxanthomonas sp. SE1]WFC43208.1 hypothetical protein OY559_06775 [Pseudoxanthomonas sp. SE1]
MSDRIQPISTLTVYLSSHPDTPVHGFRDDNGDLHVGQYFGDGSRVLDPEEIHRTAGERAVEEYKPLPISREQLQQENRVMALCVLIALIAFGLRCGLFERASQFITAAPSAASSIRG